MLASMTNDSNVRLVCGDPHQTQPVAMATCQRVPKFGLCIFLPSNQIYFDNVFAKSTQILEVQSYFRSYSQFEIISSLVLDENEDYMFLMCSLQVQNHRRPTLMAV